MSTEKIALVFLCNKNYFEKFLKTFEMLTKNGNYSGDIVLVIGDDLVDDECLKLSLLNSVIIKHFPDIKLTDEFLNYSQKIPRNPRWFKSLFQFHKFHLFSTYFKNWNFVFYIDCGASIFSDINPILEIREKDILLAHSDAYPLYHWKLHTQFSRRRKCNFYKELNEKFNLNIDYPQTTIMLFDTSIITDNTYQDLVDLMYKYPNCITNDQGIIALYFTNIFPKWKQIPTGNNEINFYDYSRREDKPYIILKCD